MINQLCKKSLRGCSFQPASLRARQACRGTTPTCCSFIPQAREGSTAGRDSADRVGYRFNPQAREGSTRQQQAVGRHGRVSTHESVRARWSPPAPEV